MNLLTAIVIYAGGPGSGCNPNVGKCGRHSGSGSKPSPGDKVVLTKPVDMHESKSVVLSKVTKHTMQPGTPAQVVNTAPGLVTIRVKKMHPVTVSEDSVFVHKYAPAKITPAEVSKRYIKQQFETPDGAKVTVIKRKGEPTDPEPKKITASEHRLKGRFRDITGALYQKGFKGPAQNFIKMLNIEKMQSDPNVNSKVFSARPKGDTDPLRGTTVWIHRDLNEKNARIIEMNTGQYGRPETTRRFNYKNLGAASGMLNRRYGIRFALKG